MRAFDPTWPTSRRWLHVVAWSVSLWIVVYLGALFCAAPQVRQLQPASSVTVQAGPLPLVKVSKATGRQGAYVLSFDMQRGLVFLGFLCFALEGGILIGAPAAYHWHNRRREVHNRRE